MRVLVVECLKCHERLAPSRIKAMQKYCPYCEAIDKGEQEAKHREILGQQIENANRRIS